MVQMPKRSYPYCELTCPFCRMRNPEPLPGYRAVRSLAQCTGLAVDLHTTAAIWEATRIRPQRASRRRAVIRDILSSPKGYADAPKGYADAPKGYADAPKGYRNISF